MIVSINCCQIVVVGNRGLCNIPHFDLVGDDLYCNIGLLQPIYIFEGSKSKNTLLDHEILNIINTLNQPNIYFQNLLNWQEACRVWNALNADFITIPSEIYMNINNMPNYNLLNIDN